MFSPDLTHLIGQEQHKDRLRQIEYLNLIATAQRRDSGKMGVKAVNWLGSQLVKWGTRLQTYQPSPLVRTSKIT